MGMGFGLESGSMRQGFVAICSFLVALYCAYRTALEYHAKCNVILPPVTQKLSVVLLRPETPSTSLNAQHIFAMLLRRMLYRGE